MLVRDRQDEAATDTPRKSHTPQGKRLDRRGKNASLGESALVVGAAAAVVLALVTVVAGGVHALDVSQSAQQTETAFIAMISASVFGLIVLASFLALRLLRDLKSSETRFRGTFENAAVGIAHVGTDGAWLCLNNRLCEIVGYEREELLGMTFQDITHPDDLSADLALFHRALTGEIDTYRMEKRYFHKAGHPVWVNLSVSLERGCDGAPLHFISVIEDVTDKKQAEEALRMSETRFREFAENLDGAMWILDAPTRAFLYLGPGHADVWGCEMKPTSDTPEAWVERVHPEDRRSARRVLLEAEREKSQAEFRVVHPDGTVRWLRTLAFPICDNDGEVCRVAGITKDITERVLYEKERQARKRAEELLRVRVAFLHHLSHEVRTPLTTIVGFAEVVRDEALTAEQREHAEIVKRNAEALEHTLGAALDLAQLESGSLLAWPEEVDFVTEVLEAVEHLRPMAELKQLDIDVTAEVNPLVGQTDRRCLRRTLNLLLGAGITNTPAGCVYVWVLVEGNEVVVRVRDTNEGDVSDLAEGPTDQEGRPDAPMPLDADMNINLQLIHRLVEAIEGTFDVDTLDSAGTVFTVRLPLSPELPPQGDTLVSSPVTERQLSGDGASVLHAIQAAEMALKEQSDTPDEDA